jgi:hypothetical protein
LDEYVELVVKTRLGEAEKQLQWIIEAFETVINLDIFALMTASEFEQRVCGSNEITVDMLKSIDESNKNHETVKQFFEVFERFSTQQRR